MVCSAGVLDIYPITVFVCLLASDFCSCLICALDIFGVLSCDWHLSWFDPHLASLHIIRRYYRAGRCFCISLQASFPFLFQDSISKRLSLTPYLGLPPLILPHLSRLQSLPLLRNMSHLLMLYSHIFDLPNICVPTWTINSVKAIYRV